MRWETAPSVAGNEIYHLYKDDRKILTLSIHPFSNSARVEIDEEKRVILIRKEGFRRKRIVLRNEYGIKIGELGHDNKQDFIDMNNDRFYYYIQQDPCASIVLYKESLAKPLVACRLNTNNGKTSLAFGKEKNLQNLTQTSILTAMCWWLFLPVAKENFQEINATGLAL